MQYTINKILPQAQVMKLNNNMIDICDIIHSCLSKFVLSNSEILTFHSTQKDCIVIQAKHSYVNIFKKKGYVERLVEA